MLFRKFFGREETSPTKNSTATREVARVEVVISQVEVIARLEVIARVEVGARIKVAARAKIVARVEKKIAPLITTVN